MNDQERVTQFLEYIKNQGKKYQKIIDLLEKKTEDESIEDIEELRLLLDIIKSENLDLELAGLIVKHLWGVIEKTIEPVYGEERW